MEQVAGWSALEVANVNGRSVLITCKNLQPLKILNPRAPAGSCHVVLSSYGGGLVSGDVIRLAIHGGAGSRLFVGSQSNTKVFKAVGEAAAEQHTRGTLAAGALAVVFPDPVVPQAGSRYRQVQHWQLEPGALLLLTDWFHSGRTDSGEQYQFTSFHSELRVHLADRLVLLDRFDFRPQEHIAASPANFGSHHTFFSLYLVGSPDDARFNTLAAALLRLKLPEADALHYTLADKPAVVTVAKVRDGVYVVRAAAHRRADLEPLCALVLEALAAPELLGYNPWKRKF